MAYTKRSNNNGGNNRNNNNRNHGGNDQKKHTGSTSGMDKKKRPYVSGWNYSRRHGIVSYFACPFKGSVEVTSKKSGKVWQNWMVKVKPEKGAEYITSGMYDKASGKVIMQAEGMVMNPRTNYCGKFTR